MKTAKNTDTKINSVVPGLNIHFPFNKNYTMSQNAWKKKLRNSIRDLWKNRNYYPAGEYIKNAG